MLFDNISPLLRGTVGNNFENEEDDVKNLKNNFQSIGRYNDEIENGIYDRELDKAITGFQKDNNLKVDGFVRPGGETETTLIGEILDLPKDNDDQTTKIAAAPVLAAPTLIGAIGRVAGSRLAKRGLSRAWQLWQEMTTDEREDEVDKLECDRLYEMHKNICNDVTERKGVRAGAVCFASAADIYAACLAGKPDTEWPELMD